MERRIVLDVLTAVYAAAGIDRVQRGQDNLVGKVRTIEAAQNASGLHRR